MLEPFLKWAGGKRWLVQRYNNFLPKRFNRYFEPFLGSGSVFFNLLPHSGILADKNEELINAYQAIKIAPRKIHKRLKYYQKRHNENFYYKTREIIPNDPLERAARFIYLNRTCFNGLYRVNRQGRFNVPMGSKTLVEFPEGYLDAISIALQRAVFAIADFETIIDNVKNGDFVYLDPPYTVMHNSNNFIKYNANLFSWEDQVRLARAVRRANDRGSMIMLSNADHITVKNLYRDFGQHYQIERISNLASSSEHRRKTTELFIRNY